MPRNWRESLLSVSARIDARGLSVRHGAAIRRGSRRRWPSKRSRTEVGAGHVPVSTMPVRFAGQVRSPAPLPVNDQAALPKVFAVTA